MTSERVACFDANVIVRAALGQSERALEWVASAGGPEADVVAPDVLWLEVGNAFAGYVRARTITPDQGRGALAAALRIPVRTAPTSIVADAALAIALDRGLSVFDAAYVAVAEAEGAVLVTADRRLAGATARSELIV